MFQVTEFHFHQIHLEREMIDESPAAQTEPVSVPFKLDPSFFNRPPAPPSWVLDLAKLQVKQCIPKVSKPKPARQKRKWTMMGTADLYGQLGMIMCWYWDWEGGEGSFQDAVKAVRLVPRLVEGRTENFTQDDWWLILDAIGSYPDRTPVMDEIFLLADQGMRGLLPEGKRTKNFAKESQYA